MLSFYNRAAKEGIHSSIIQLGLQYASGIVCGSNARCIALIEALIEVCKVFCTLIFEVLALGNFVYST